MWLFYLCHVFVFTILEAHFVLFPSTLYGGIRAGSDAGSFQSGQRSHSMKKLTGAWLDMEWLLVDNEQAKPVWAEKSLFDRKQWLYWR